MRYSVEKESLQKWFSSLKMQSGLSWIRIAKLYGITHRTLFEWRTGCATLPYKFVKFVYDHFGIDFVKKKEELSDHWSKSKSGKIGGLQRKLLYGNPGTVEGRRLGGLHSIQTHQNKKNSAFIARKVMLPKQSVALAEFIGIVLGDGGITKRQVVITVHKKDDEEYSRYIKNLIYEIFGEFPSLVKRKSENVINITVSRTLLVTYLLSIGLHCGNKVYQQVDVPEWIKENRDFKIACVRGLLDTDGCFYVDKHVIKHKRYLNCGMNFTNRSLPLLAFFKKSLEENGYHPTQRTPFSVFLRREKEILKYISEFGTSNPKIERRLQKYLLKKHGRVPKRS